MTERFRELKAAISDIATALDGRAAKYRSLAMLALQERKYIEGAYHNIRADELDEVVGNLTFLLEIYTDDAT
jgi:hypothetical protein